MNERTEFLLARSKLVVVSVYSLVVGDGLGEHQVFPGHASELEDDGGLTVELGVAADYLGEGED